MAFQKPTSKAATPVAQSTPAASSTQKKAKPRKSPEKLLQYKGKDEGAEFELLCGLFKETSKKGTIYYSGCIKEQEIRFMLFKQKDGSFTLNSQSFEKDAKLEKLAELKEMTGKKDPNTKFLVGKDTDGGSYFVFDKKAK